MRSFICLLAALSLAFNLAQVVEAGCSRPDPCTCEHERLGQAALEVCGCEGDGNRTTAGCQLYRDEDKYGVMVFPPPEVNSCKSTATVECRDAIHQYAREYPDTCKESTRQFDDKLTHGAWAHRLAENCPASGGGKRNKPDILFFVTLLMVTYIIL